MSVKSFLQTVHEGFHKNLYREWLILPAELKTEKFIDLPRSL